MPELPEVETVCRGLAPVLKGRVLTTVRPRRRDLRKPFPRGFGKILSGARVRVVERRAKYILVWLQTHRHGTKVLIWHLGMSGQVRIFKPGETVPKPATHDHVVLETDRGAVIYFRDPRRFGLMDIGDEDALKSHPLLAGLGFEPFDPTLDGRVLAGLFKDRRTSVKEALMNQKYVVGIGNIYACEILYRARISPTAPASVVKGAKATRLLAAVRDVLTAAIKAGGSTISDHRTPDGGLGYFQHAFAVYGREGEPCPDCNCRIARTGGIQRIQQGGRSTFFCAKRQG